MLKAKRFLFVSSFLVLLVAIAGVTMVQAQSISGGKLTGTIMDDKGEPLPGVALEISGPALISGKRATTTTARGTYVFLDLPVGKYKLTATIPSFKTAVQENIAISVGTSLTVDLTMQLGAIEETITVTAAGPIVDTKTSGIDSKLDRAMLEKLPTNRDAFYDLALTAPGMFGVGSSGGWLPSPTAYGGSTMENVFLVNGVNTTAPRGAAFGPLVNVNYNAVEEVRIIALGSKAEYGSFSGAAIDVLTRSGGSSSRRISPSRGGTRTAAGSTSGKATSSWRTSNPIGRPILRSAGPSSRTRSGSMRPTTTSTRRPCR
jgi:Carboxypeptidase regulatory-like domain/TonB-dependent Receptor Plug Domain